MSFDNFKPKKKIDPRLRKPLKTRVYEPPYKAIKTMLTSYKSTWHYGEVKPNGRHKYPNAEIVADSIEKWLRQMGELK